MTLPQSIPTPTLAEKIEWKSEVVSAETPFSCAVACVESLLRHLGRPMTQPEMFARFANHFPAWQKQEGIIDHPTEFDRLLNLTGFGPRRFASSAADLLSAFDPARGGFVFTQKFYDENGPPLSLCDKGHCLRILKVSQDFIWLMDPLRKPAPAVVGCFPWSEYHRWEPLSVILV